MPQRPALCLRALALLNLLTIFLPRRYRPPLPVRAPAGLVALMRECWCADRAARPDFAACAARLEILQAANQQVKKITSLICFGATLLEACACFLMISIVMYFSLCSNSS
jgi:hypothetical protein